MPYFSQGFLDFFKELSENNSTEWFNANRKRYEKEVKAPFAVFVQEMIGRISQHEPDSAITPSDAITRINKDIRFSKDKTPYNTHVAANISRFGKKDKAYPGLYFQFSHDKIALFGGAYMVEPPRLQQIRQLIADNPTAFAAIYTNANFQEKYGSLQGEKNKRVPEPFQHLAAQEPLIANKQFYYTQELPANLLLHDSLPDRLMEYYLAGRPVNNFLKQAFANG